jgi:predicted ferric reductase
MTAYSYERINVLHQVGGYTTIACSFLHAILMCVAWWRRNSLHTLIEIEQISGIIASAALLIVIITVLTLKKIQYELFYVTHIAMYMLFIINVAMHQRHFEHKVIIVTLLAASMWASDRLLRGCRILWYSRGNHATITPLPHGGTRIVLRRSPSRAEPGLHCFLWIPTIRSFESHPFTIVSQTPSSLEFVVAAYDGFTNDLHRYAVENPGASLRASIDGPYGVVQNLAKVADKVILIAGGSGASFTFGTALDIIKKRGRSTKPSIEFIWTVKEQGKSTAYPSHIDRTCYQC